MKLNAKNMVLTGLVLVGLFWVVTSIGYGLWVRNGPGGGFLPLLAGSICIFCSLFVLIQERKRESDAHLNIKALIPIGALVGAIVATYFVGLTISMAIFSFLWLFLYEKRPLRSSVLVSVIWSGCLYALFGLWLQSPLPTGMLGLL